MDMKKFNNYNFFWQDNRYYMFIKYIIILVYPYLIVDYTVLFTTSVVFIYCFSHLACCLNITS